MKLKNQTIIMKFEENNCFNVKLHGLDLGVETTQL